MNQTQLKYARERAERIFKQAEVRLKASHTVEEIKLTKEEARKALCDRKFSVRKYVKNQGWYITDFVRFDGECEKSFDQKSYDRDLAVLKAAYDKLTDELVLGDQTEALKLLQAFEAANGGGH